MANKILNTVFTNLDKAISGNWNDITQPIKHNNSYDLSNGGDKIIYKTKDKTDFQQHKLELQQNSWLNDRWVKANVDLSVQAFTGLNNVKLMYRDADLMDSFPEIGAALNILSQEATIANSNGQIISVSSKSDRIRAILEDLFVNRLDIQVTAEMIIRQMCKYGNQFMMLNIDHKNGVMGWRQLPVFNVERLENGIENPYGGQGIRLAQNAKNSGDLSTKFIWTDETSEQVPFRNWQIAHFRLIGNSMYLPYGCLVGDTRVETEYGFKNISDIKIGDKIWTFNVDTHQKELSTVTMWMNKGVKEIFKVNLKHYEIEGTSDHKLLCYENNDLVYKQISELKKGDLVVCYNNSDKKNRQILIDKSELKEFEHGQKSLKWWTDYIDNIPNVVNTDFAKLFGFLLGDGWLTHGYHVMFALGEYKTLNDKYINLLESFSGKKVSFVKQTVKDRKLPFHTVYVGSKMLYTILKRMGFDGSCYTKRIPSWVYESSNEIKEAFLNGLIDADGTLNAVTNNTLSYTLELANEQLIKDIKILAQSLGYRTGKIGCRDRIGKNNNKKPIIASCKSYYMSFYMTQNTQYKKYKNISFKENGYIVEEVKSITPNGLNETFDITVDSKNSNFFANNIITHNCSSLNSARRHWRMLSLMEDMMLIYRLERSVERRVYKIYVGAIDDADVQAYVQEIANNFKRTPIIDPMTGQIDLRKNIMDVSQDLFIPVRDPNAATPIDTLPAAQNLTAIDDIKYIQNKVLTALNIPKSFLNFDEAQGNGQNLALMDVRFTRTINRIQQAFLMELTKVASIHLYLLGFEDDLTNFSLSMNNPSTQAEQLEIDNITKKIGAIQTAVADPGNGIPLMSLTRALKEIMKWSDKDIQENFEEIRLEKALASELEMTNQIIKKTGIFDNVDRIYGEPGATYQENQQQGDGSDGGAHMGGGAPMGGGDFGGGLDSLGAPGSEDEGELGGAEGEMPIEDAASGGDMPPASDGQMMEIISKNKNLLTEQKKHTISDLKKGRTIVERVKVYDDTLLINEEFDSMLKSIDGFLEE